MENGRATVIVKPTGDVLSMYFPEGIPGEGETFHVDGNGVPLYSDGLVVTKDRSVPGTCYRARLNVLMAYPARLAKD